MMRFSPVIRNSSFPVTKRRATRTPARPKRVVHAAISVGNVAECACGWIERWPETWQAIAAAADHARAVRRPGTLVHWGADTRRTIPPAATGVADAEA
jgi:hypothetical protein